MPREWRRAFRLPFGRQQLARELDDELEFHVAMREARLRDAGLAAADARVHAERRFGDRGRIRAECLHIDRRRLAREQLQMMLEDFRHDATVALRALRRAPAFTAAAALTLALGIGATTAIFSVAYGVLLRPLPFPDADRLVQPFTVSRGSDELRGYWSDHEFLDLAAQVPSLAAVGAYDDVEVTLTGAGTPERLRATVGTPGLFEALRVQPVIGRAFAPDESVEQGARVAMLGHALWQRRFGGDPHVVGQAVRLNGREVTIVGVLPSGVELARADLYLPLALDPANLRPRGNHYLEVIGRLAPGATLERLRAELATLGARTVREYPDFYGDPEFSMDAVGLREAWVGDVRPTLLVLTGAVALLLVLACVNVANLLLVRAEARQREIAVRVALGAGRGRLARQLLTEALLLALLGAAVGLPLAALGVRALLTLAPTVLPPGTQLGVDGAVLLAAGAVVLLAAALAALAPMLQTGALDVRGAIGTGAVGGGRRGGRLRATLVTAEIAVATLVLVGAALVGRSFWQLMHVDTGFGREQVLTFDTSIPRTSVPDSTHVPQAYAELLARLAALPQVRSAALTSHLPLSGSLGDWTVDVEGYTTPEGEPTLSPDFRIVSERYFQTLGIPVRRGRDFASQDGADDAFAVVVSESFARHFFGDRPALGRRMRPSGSGTNPWMTVVGVVGDVRSLALDVAPRPTYYMLDRQFPAMFGQAVRGTSVVVRTTGDARPLLAAIPRAVWTHDPDLAVARLRPYDAVVGESVSRERFATAVLLAFGAVALLLAITGVYGVLSYSVARRRREMGIRIALGARASQVRRSIVGDGARLAAVGLVVGLAGALAGSRLLASLLYDVPATDPLSFAGAALLLLLAAVAASYLPARRATRVDPVEALRSE